MTLLFYLRSPAGNTDTGQTDGDTGKHPKYEEMTKRELKAEQIIIWDAEKKKRRKQDEELILLFMHEFEGYEH